MELFIGGVVGTSQHTTASSPHFGIRIPCKRCLLGRKSQTHSFVCSWDAHTIYIYIPGGSCASGLKVTPCCIPCLGLEIPAHASLQQGNPTSWPCSAGFASFCRLCPSSHRSRVKAVSFYLHIHKYMYLYVYIHAHINMYIYTHITDMRIYKHM